MQKVINGSILVLILIFISQVSAEPVDGESYGNWTVRCESKAGKEECFIFQNLVLQEGGSRLLHVAVGYLSAVKKTPVILVSMPLGISLPPGASIKIDDQEPIKFQIERCEPSGCRGGFKLKESMLEMFIQGQTTTVTFHDGQRKAIDVPLSLAGFSDGLEALKK